MLDLVCQTFKHNFLSNIWIKSENFVADSRDMCGLSGEVLKSYKTSREAVSSGNLESLPSGLPKST